MKRGILLLLSAILILSSCELFYDEPGLGDVYVVSIGIDYQNNSAVNDLYGTVTDAKELFRAIKKIADKTQQDWKGYLLLQEGDAYDPTTLYLYEGEGIDKTNYASRDNLFVTLTAIKNQATEQDLTILTYSGHGVDQTGEMVMAHTDTDGHASSIESQLVKHQDLLASMAEIPGRKLIILDSCFSGVFVPESTSSLSTVLSHGMDDWYAKFWEESTYNIPDLYVLTASALADSYERSIEQGHKHGVFSFALLQALGWEHPHDEDIATVEPMAPPSSTGSILSVDSLYTYIKSHQELPLTWSILRPSQEYQHPLVFGGAMDMVLFRF